MIKAPSVQNEYTLIWSGDPALRLPEDKDEAARVLQLARDTGDWSKLLAEEQPTLFHFAPLTRSQLSWLVGENQHCSWLDRPLSPPEFADLVLRAAIRGVDNFGKHKVQRHKHSSGQWLADASIIEAIATEAGPALAADIINEFSSIIIAKATEPLRPL